MAKMVNKCSSIRRYLAHQLWTVGDEPVIAGFPEFPEVCLVFTRELACDENEREYTLVKIASMDEKEAVQGGYPMLLPASSTWQNLAGYTWERAYEAISGSIDSAFAENGFVFDAIQ